MDLNDDAELLPHRLAKGKHPVIIKAGRDDTLDEFREAVERDYVHVKFTETRGGTELGFYLDKEHSRLDDGDLQKGTGEIRVAGNLNLDGVDVRVEADIDLATLKGSGNLVVLETS